MTRTADDSHAGVAQHPAAQPDEVITIAASRLLEDGKTIFAGIGQPPVAAAIAKRRQAPQLTVLLEGGMIGIQLAPGELPASTNELRAATGAEMLTDTAGIFLMAQRGFFNYGFIGVAQVDRYGNVDTSVVGSVSSPTVRLPGPSRVNDIASMCNQTVIVTTHEPRRFVERVDLVTNPGHLDGGSSHREAGLRHGGPRWAVTNLAVLDFAESSRRMRVRALQAGVTLDQVQEATGFELLVHEDCYHLAPVDNEELRVLRHLTRGTEEEEMTTPGTC